MGLFGDPSEERSPEVMRSINLGSPLHILLNRLISRNTIRKSRPFAGDQMRKQPSINSFTSTIPFPVTSSKSKRFLALLMSTSTILKKAFISGVSTEASNSSHVKNPFPVVSKCLKSLDTCPAVLNSFSFLLFSMTPSMNTPVITLSMHISVNKMYIVNTMPAVMPISSMSGLQTTSQSIPPVVDCTREKMAGRREPQYNSRLSDNSPPSFANKSRLLCTSCVKTTPRTYATMKSSVQAQNKGRKDAPIAESRVLSSPIRRKARVRRTARPSRRVRRKLKLKPMPAATADRVSSTI
mmetsp:Transcript_96506/g.170936  ORF Transcript_96506/g.170936 Transcript_96506/m.170936 type:complete len:296 (-) Transcript_96506:131-1018(-)